MFTDGKDRFYENLMRELPRNNKNSGGSKYVPRKFKYRYKDIACECCLHHKAASCTFCPHLVENLNDLLTDKDFLIALENAENCKTKHRETLLLIKAEMYMGAGST